MDFTVGQKVKVGYTKSLYDSTTWKVIILGQLKDGRYLCERMPVKTNNYYGRIVYYGDWETGMFLREEVEDIHEVVL